MAMHLGLFARFLANLISSLLEQDKRLKTTGLFMVTVAVAARHKFYAEIPILF